MNNRVNFTVVGMFVSMVSILFFVGIYWVIKPKSDDKVLMYGLLVTESITGISVGTNVKYQGLTVGRVKGFKINPENLSEIMMGLEIGKDVPIRDGVMASIKLQGITGLSYIDIQVEKNAKPLEEREYMGHVYKIIPFKPSLFNGLTSSASDIIKVLQDILNKTDKIIDENMQESEVIIHELAHITKQLKKLLSDDNIEKTSTLITNTNDLVNNADLMINEYISISREVNTTLHVVNESILNDNYNLKKIVGSIPQETVLMLKEIRQLSLELSKVLEKFEEDPNSILFESTEPTLGPGE
ncbi:MlaD family protein [Campylobacterota bacterium]